LNSKQLIANTKPNLRKARKLALTLLDAGITAVLPKNFMKQLILKNNVLTIHKKKFNLTKFKRIYVIGGGKASGVMAEILEKQLKSKITAGAVNDHIGKAKTKRIKLTKAGHPIPNKNSIRGTKRMLELAHKATKDDLVICLISGGGSALMQIPQAGISLKDLQKFNDQLLRSGASINDVNCLRKHISRLKGGNLAKACYPATVISIILSDVIGDNLDVIASGPTVKDSTTFSKASKILKQYKISPPKSIANHFKKGFSKQIEDTPKQRKYFEKVYNIILANNFTAVKAMQSKAKQLKIPCTLYSKKLTGEAKVQSVKIITKANKTRGLRVFIAGGETTVTVHGHGLGGRNQEFVLAAVSKIKKPLVLVSGGTDGRDGPTDATGAIADSFSLERAKNLGINPNSFLANNDAYHFFKKLKDLVKTGPTGTNVCDLQIVVVL